MKDSSPTFASIFIIGTFTSVLSSQRYNINPRSTSRNPDYLKFHSPRSFTYITQLNSDKDSQILNKLFGEFSETSGDNSDDHEGNVKGYKIHTSTGYRTDLEKLNYGFNTRLNFPQSTAKDANFQRSDPNYSNKSPIQILPSRFPPPLEKLIQNIQNYFSTYNHPDLQNRPYLPQSPQVTTSTELEAHTTHSTEAATEVTEEITTEDTEENTVVALIENKNF